MKKSKQEGLSKEEVTLELLKIVIDVAKARNYHPSDLEESLRKGTLKKIVNIMQGYFPELYNNH